LWVFKLFDPYCTVHHQSQDISEDIRSRLSKSREDFSRTLAARADYENKLKNVSSEMPGETIAIKEEPISETEASESCLREPAEGSGNTADVSFPVTDMGPIPINLDAPEVFEALETFIGQILSPENQLVEQIIASESSSRETGSDAAELGNDESGFAWLVNTESPQPSMYNASITVDRDDDTHSSHSESGLPLEEAEFGLLPDPVSPVTPITAMVEDTDSKQKIVLMEKFENFNAYLDSGMNSFEIPDSFSDEQLFPDLMMRDELYWSQDQQHVDIYKLTYFNHLLSTDYITYAKVNVS